MHKRNTIKQILGSDTDDRSVRAEAIYKVLVTASDEKEMSELLAGCITDLHSVPKTPNTLKNQGLSQDDWDNLVSTRTELLNSHLKSSFFKSKTAIEFATQFLKVFHILDDEKEKIYAISIILNSPYVPYKELPSDIVRMTQHQFEHLVESNKEKSDLIKYVVGIPFKTTVELASLVLPILDDESNKEVRVALLGLTYSAFQSRLISLMQQRS